MRALKTGWLLLSRHSSAHFSIPDTQIVHSLAAATHHLAKGQTLGLLVDHGYRGPGGDAWSVAFIVRERFPHLPVAVLSESDPEEIDHA